MSSDILFANVQGLNRCSKVIAVKKGSPLLNRF
jgi:hypothetical protein